MAVSTGSRSATRRTTRRSDPRGQELCLHQVPIHQLRPWPDNPRVMPEVEMTKLRRSIETFGMVEPIVVRQADGMVIGGHQRLEVAKALGFEQVPVVYVDVSIAQAKALNLALNRIGGEWDVPRLGELLEGLRDLPDFDETLSGFDESEVDELLAELERKQQPPPYEETFDVAAEVLQAQRESAPTRAKPGQIWQLGRHRMLCGDCLASGALERLCAGAMMDLIVTDPPYGIGFQSTQPRAGQRKRPLANDERSGDDAFLQKALPAIKAVMKRGAVLYLFAGGGGPEPVLATALLAISQHFDLMNCLVWDRVDPGLGWRWRRSWEAILEASLGKPRGWFGGTDKRNVLRFPRAIPQADEHPTPKPVPLLEELIRASAPTRGLILDPFAGAGPTLIAAERTGRICFAVELDPRYCDMVIARWEALTGQEAKPFLPDPEQATT